MKIEWTNPLEMLHKMTGAVVIVKDSTEYLSSKWTPHTMKKTLYPVQRLLTLGECVLDFDGVTEDDIIKLIKYYEKKGLKFIVWLSSTTGAHIHFWTDVYGKLEKAELVKIITEATFKELGIKADLLPMGHGFIRCEHSTHPSKGTRKNLYYSTLTVGNYINQITGNLRETVMSVSPRVESNNSGPSKGDDDHGCIRYIMDNQFTDGKKRLMFSLISYYKNSMSDKELFEKVVKWCHSQEYNVAYGFLRAQISSNRGLVGCNFRHNLLEELGHTFKCGN